MKKKSEDLTGKHENKRKFKGNARKMKAKERNEQIKEVRNKREIRGTIKDDEVVFRLQDSVYLFVFLASVNTHSKVGKKKQ